MDEWTLGKRRFMICTMLLCDSMPKFLRALINQRCKPDLQTYIKDSQGTIRHLGSLRQNRHYIEALLQQNQTIDKWDINLLLWFLTQVTPIEEFEREQVFKARAIRNELVHHNNAQLDKQQYDNIVNDIKSILSYFENSRDDDFEVEKERIFLHAILYMGWTEGQQYQALMMGKQYQLVLLMNWYQNDAKEMAGIIRHSETGSAIKTADAVESRSSKPGLMSVHGKHILDNALELILNPRMLPSYLLEKGMASKESIALIEWLQADAEAEYSTAESVWIGYDITLYEKKIPTIVAMYKSFPKDLQFKSRYLSFEVIQKEIGDLSPEAKYVAEYERKENMQFSPDETEYLQKCLDSNTERLMNEHSNLLIISASKVKSTRYGLPNANLEHKACVVLYVHMKGIIPIREEPFPAELDSFPVDVRESMYENYGRPDDYFEDLIMGSQIQSEYQVYGTLGGFVKLKSGGLGCLTCCHIFKTSESQKCFPSKKDVKMTKLKKKMYQPSVRTEAFGEVIQCIDCQKYKDKIGVDVALIKISDDNRLPRSGRFPNADSPSCGFSADRPMMFDSGDIIKSWEEVPYTCKIVKYGATTEHTIGMLNQTCISSRGFQCKQNLDNATPRKLLCKQIEVWSVDNQPFAKPGDSGSLVFAVTGEQNQPRIRALGMIVGGSKHGSAMATPIWAVLGLLRELKHIKSSSSLLCFRQLHSAASSDPDSEGDSDEDERKNALIDELKSEVTAMKKTISTMDDRINHIKEQMVENHVSIKSDIATNHDSIKGDLDDRINHIKEQMFENHVSIKSDIATNHDSIKGDLADLAAIMQHISSNATNAEVIKENNTIGENDHRNNRDTN